MVDVKRGLEDSEIAKQYNEPITVNENPRSPQKEFLPSISKLSVVHLPEEINYQKITYV